MNAYYNTYNGLGVTLTSEQSKQYDTAYGIAYSYNLSAPRMEDFAAGNGEAIIDYYAQQAYAKDPNYNKTGWGNTVRQRIMEIEARNKAAQAASTAVPAVYTQKIGMYAGELPSTKSQQAATLPTVTTPPATPAKKTWKDYLPWIIVGGVVAFGAYKMLAGGKKKRR